MSRYIQGRDRDELGCDRTSEYLGWSTSQTRTNIERAGHSSDVGTRLAGRLLVQHEYESLALESDCCLGLFNGKERR
jgi:hypothetical protein